ncbi:MAG TPA: hypothetical protein VFO10_14580 [Oligoflexus sp.]|nr:hypothetical protein [Oligoflexus sp.]HET9238483.1 hypothetical protein [Oligoflexus sp.]
MAPRFTVDPDLHPNFHTYVRSKAPWVQLQADHPKFQELPLLD